MLSFRSLQKLSYLLFFVILTTSIADAQIYEKLTATQCDSLILANADNPNFVILDVRTRGEYRPQHLEEAINIDYYANSFQAQLDALDKDKSYLIHCRSGSRSGNTLNIMPSLNFREVYDMRGGINSWNSNGLATTSAFAPRFMFVSDNNFPNKEVSIGETDTITVTITNRANDMLSFNAISELTNTSFRTDFDMSTELEGAEDYTFHIYYTAASTTLEELEFTISSNAGQGIVTIQRTGATTTPTFDINQLSFEVYPNPAHDIIKINGLGAQKSIVDIINSNGQLISSQHLNTSSATLDISTLTKGIYFIKVITDEKQGVRRFTIE